MAAAARGATACAVVKPSPAADLAASAASRVLPTPGAPASTNAAGSGCFSFARIQSISASRDMSGISPVSGFLTAGYFRISGRSPPQNRSGAAGGRLVAVGPPGAARAVVAGALAPDQVAGAAAVHRDAEVVAIREPETGPALVRRTGSAVGRPDGGAERGTA